MKRSPQGRWAFCLQGRSFDPSLGADRTQRKVVTFRKLISLLMALQNKSFTILSLLWSQILSIVWLWSNKLKMNVSCLSKAQRLCAEFVENFVLQTVEAFVGLHAMSVRRPWGTGTAHLCWPTRWMDKKGQLVLEMQMSDDPVNHGLGLRHTI